MDQRDLVPRLFAFVGVLTVMWLWEWMAPRRPPQPGAGRRRLFNLSLMTFNTVMVRMCLPMSAVAAASAAESGRSGLLHHLNIPLAAKIALSIVVLDFLIYLQHVVFHAVPVLWRLHAVHHRDQELDVTTAVRFHTLEILLSVVVKVAAVLVLGAPVVAVIAFEIILNAMAMINHSNVNLPARLDRILRCVVVTPNVHEIHHSPRPVEANSNFGFNIVWWDYLLGTYRPPRQPSGLTVRTPADRGVITPDRT